MVKPNRKILILLTGKSGPGKSCHLENPEPETSKPEEAGTGQTSEASPEGSEATRTGETQEPGSERSELVQLGRFFRMPVNRSSSLPNRLILVPGGLRPLQPPGSVRFNLVCPWFSGPGGWFWVVPVTWLNLVGPGSGCRWVLVGPVAWLCRLPGGSEATVWEA